MAVQVKSELAEPNKNGVMPLCDLRTTVHHLSTGMCYPFHLFTKIAYMIEVHGEQQKDWWLSHRK
jgi:hypothetical protein